MMDALINQDMIMFVIKQQMDKIAIGEAPSGFKIVSKNENEITITPEQPFIDSDIKEIKGSVFIKYKVKNIIVQL